MLKVTKFGGSSLCDSAGFARVREIVLADPARRVVVVSAAGGSVLAAQASRPRTMTIARSIAISFFIL